MPNVLSAILQEQDAKIRNCLAGKEPMQFWYANAPVPGGLEERYARLHELGFDNYPVASIPAVDALQPHLFFYERILGAHLQTMDGQKGDFFHTWCPPLIQTPEEIFRLAFDLDVSPLWNDYEIAVQEYLRRTPVDERCPVELPGLCPLDTACNLCGAENFFSMVYEAPEAVDHLLDSLVKMLLGVHRRLARLEARPVAAYGFPGVYCNDLQLSFLSPAHIARFVLPCYQRMAASCGGLLLALNASDLGILEAVLHIPKLIGCAFSKALPLSVIKQRLGSKVFLIANYVFDEAFDKPTYHNGLWCNPIVQTYSRELPAAYRELSGSSNLAIAIERHRIEDVCEERRKLQTEAARRSDSL